MDLETLSVSEQENAQSLSRTVFAKGSVWQVTKTYAHTFASDAETNEQVE